MSRSSFLDRLRIFSASLAVVLSMLVVVSLPNVAAKMKRSLLASILSSGLAVRGAAIVPTDRDARAYNATDMAAVAAHMNSSYALDAEAHSLEKCGIQKRGLVKLVISLSLSLVGVNRQFAMGVVGLIVHPYMCSSYPPNTYAAKRVCRKS